jgi:hypothetical protein
MCDERTASRMTAISTAKRNGLNGRHVVQTAILQEHWTKGLGAPDYKHQAHIKVPKLEAAQSTIQRPAPKLMDLLNPTPANDPFQACESDPYKLNDMWDPDNEFDLDEGMSSAPTILWGGGSLAVEEWVDLDNSNLLARFSEDGVQPAPKAATKDSPKPSAAKEAEWVEENYSVDDLW